LYDVIVYILTRGLLRLCSKNNYLGVEMKRENVRKKEEERKKSLGGTLFVAGTKEREHSNGGVPLLLSSSLSLSLLLLSLLLLFARKACVCFL